MWREPSVRDNAAHCTDDGDPQTAKVGSVDEHILVISSQPLSSAGRQSNHLGTTMTVKPF